jgi:hypothetical protein
MSGYLWQKKLLSFPTSLIVYSISLFISQFCNIEKLFPFPSLSCPEKTGAFFCLFRFFFVSEDFHFFFIVTCNTSFLSFLTRYSSVLLYLYPSRIVWKERWDEIYPISIWSWVLILIWIFVFLTSGSSSFFSGGLNCLLLHLIDPQVKYLRTDSSLQKSFKPSRKTEVTKPFKTDVKTERRLTLNIKTFLITFTIEL